MLDPDLIHFVRNSVRSIWALELLLLLRRSSPRAIPPDELVRVLRATPSLIHRCLAELQKAGVVTRTQNGEARFEPDNPELALLCDGLDRASVERPIALRDAITSSTNDKLRNFSDAFKLRKDDE